MDLSFDASEYAGDEEPRGTVALKNLEVLRYFAEACGSEGSQTTLVGTAFSTWLTGFLTNTVSTLLVLVAS
jgi:hypothetical protein